MLLDGRKFLVYTVALLPLLGCALPNFAALAPTPEPEPTPAVDLEIPTRPVTDGSEPQIDSNIEPPTAPVPVDNLPPIQPELNLAQSEPLQLRLGVPYQFGQSATIESFPPAGQSVVYSVTDGAVIDLQAANGEPINDLVVIETAEKNYYLVPLPADGVSYTLSVTTVGSEAAIVQGDYFFGFPPERIFELGEILADEVSRIELDGTANRPILIELRSFGPLDGVLEIYGPEGVLLSVDEKGAGENETVIYTPEQTGRLTLVILGFQGTSGAFEINATQFP